MTAATSNSGRLPVLIAGGGPVGLGLALELAWRGVRSQLIDQGDGVVRLSKMGAVSVRSMEHCRRWGVAENVRNAGFPADYPLDQIFCTSLNGERVGVISFPSHASAECDELSPERKQRCPQLWFDPILQRKACADPLVTLTYSSKLTGFTDHGDRVTADVENTETGESTTIEAAFLVGCDGGGSTVRSGLGYKLEGDRLSNSVGIYFTSYDLHAHHTMGKGTRYWMIGEDGTWGNLTVVDGSDVWRLTISGSRVPMDMAEFDADRWLRRCLGRDDIVYSITAVLPWWRNRMVADHYGRGRVWLAGDACHMNAPNGGFGMNTGLGDSVDLGWKLEGVTKGWAAPEILESYEIERRPVAIRNVNAAAANFALTRPNVSYEGVEQAGPAGEARRAALFEVLARESTPEWKSTGVHLGYRYEGSPIIVPDGSDEPEDNLVEYAPTARPGHRAPHFPLPDGRSSLDLFGRRYVLLQFDGDDGTADRIKEAAARIGMPFEAIVIDDAAAAQLYERHHVLVRPDGHVCWRGDGLDLPADELVAIVTGRRVKQSDENALRSSEVH
jgi:2-polyprenyl-6-methoxyphenol hydroxylase-like FAD-dependent oxidoreductase